ncbi:MAG: glycosyltransferase family 2 protein [Bacteroidales bacterium]|nr:glycosyltransferase family 2 protein [Bacteroidales bacterium]
MKTAVVVLNWNTKDYLRAFIPGLLHSCQQAGADLIVADSGSTDGSREVLEQEFPEVRTIYLEENKGFTGGYNLAFQALEDDGYDFFVLINSDIEVEDGWLEPLLKWMETHPECGICGPKLHGLLHNPDPDKPYIRSSCFEYAGAAGGLLDHFGFPYCRGRVHHRVEEDHGQYDNADPDVLWVTGACLLIRASLWKQLGGLDDRYFAHMEEIDLCWRAQLAGWKVNVVPQSVVWHLGGGTLPPTSPFKLKLNFRNNLLTLEKNLPGTYITQGLAPAQAARKAARFLRIRAFLDNCARIAYFCMGKPELAKAVRDAHKEWENLRVQGHHVPQPEQNAKVAGLTHKLIII